MLSAIYSYKEDLDRPSVFILLSETVVFSSERLNVGSLSLVACLGKVPLFQNKRVKKSYSNSLGDVGCFSPRDHQPVGTFSALGGCPYEATSQHLSLLLTNTCLGPPCYVCEVWGPIRNMLFPSVLWTIWEVWLRGQAGGGQGNNYFWSKLNWRL